MTEVLTTKPKTVEAIWRAEAARKAAAARDHLAQIIRSKVDHEPVREKITVRNLNFYYQDGIRALRV